MVSPSRPRSKASGVRRAVRALLALLLGLVLLVAAAEIAASFTKVGNVLGFAEDPDLLLVRQPSTEGWAWTNGRWIRVRTNALHMRGAELPLARDPEETRIVVLGDSMTFAKGLEEEDTFCALLERRLSAVRPVRVLNGGANGWETRFQRLFLEKKAMRADPDLVILAWNWNDLADALASTGERRRAALVGDQCWICRLGLGRSWIRERHAYRWLHGSTHGSGALPDDALIAKELRNNRLRIEKQLAEPERALAEDRARRFGDRPPHYGWWKGTDTSLWRLAREEVTALASFCRSAGLRLAVVLMPEPAWIGPGDVPGTERMVALLDELDVPWIDLQEDFLLTDGSGRRVGRNPALWGRYDATHPYEEGHRLIAERVADFVLARDLLGRRDAAATSQAIDR